MYVDHDNGVMYEKDELAATAMNNACGRKLYFAHVYNYQFRLVKRALHGSFTSMSC
jgi:hypothetical protein